LATGWLIACLNSGSLYRNPNNISLLIGGFFEVIAIPRGGWEQL